MIQKTVPTSSELRQLLRYEPETGKLFWLHRPESGFPRRRSALTWNTRFAGKEAFASIDGTGYCSGRILARRYRAHRVIWAMETGSWPEAEIDHINGKRNDNRRENLREVSHADNGKNKGMNKKNKSGYKGVSWHKHSNKCSAQIGCAGKIVHLGKYDNIEDAAAAYAAASVKYHMEYAR